MKKLFFIITGLLSFILGIQIQAQVTNQGQLVIQNGVSFVVKNLDFHNTATGNVQLSNNANLYLGGATFDNDGTFGDLTQTYNVYFNGTVDQEIIGDTEPLFDNLVITQSGNVSVTQKINVSANTVTVNDAGNLFDFRVKDPLNSGLRLTADNFNLTGNLRLYDDSQILPNTGVSTFSATGTGKVYRDQMGTGDKYWYNYWSAPVNNGGTWQVSNLMDGRNPENPQNIVFVYEHDADGSTSVNASQNPAYLNEAWIYTFENMNGDYLNWNYVGSTGLINPGVGYTMKGPDIKNAVRPGASGANTEFKAYTFAGLPNGGSYSFTVDNGNIYLLGNPYPSALDINDFINDNSGQFNGTVYFWEHVSGASHYLTDYGGGYATRNLTGGVPAPDWQTNATVGTKIPGRYVPVGQGFFIWNEGNATPSGNITFQNSQREFIKEDGSNSVFMRSGPTDIRIFFDNPHGIRRHLLLGWRHNTTMGEDWGWDARAFESNPYGGDMFFTISDKDYVIQAVPEIVDETRIPLHVVTTEDGEISIGIIDLVNFPSGMEIFIEDVHQGQTFPISPTVSFTTYLQQGDYNGRFYLVFRPSTTKTDDPVLTDINIYYNNGYVIVQNPNNRTVRSVEIFDLTGKLIIEKSFNGTETLYKLPVSLPAGVYLSRLNADEQVKTTKFIVE